MSNTATHRSWLGYAGLGWALSYVPIHVYWALGGLTPSIGITESGRDLRAANWGAVLVILGGGLVCLALEQRWGQILPRALRHGAAWIGGVFGILHALAFCTVTALRLAGYLGYPGDSRFTMAQMRHYDWANLLYFEPWFAIMGALLIACSLRARRRRRTDTEPAAPAWIGRVRWLAPQRAHSAMWRRAGTTLTLIGLFAVVWGVFTFDPATFAGYGPALMAAGLLTLLAHTAASRTKHTR